MIVFMSWIEDDPTQHWSMNDALDLLAERPDDISMAVTVELCETTYYSAEQMTDMMSERLADQVIERRHEIQEVNRGRYQW